MTKIIYQQYHGLIREIDLYETADEVFIELIKSAKHNGKIQSTKSHLPSQIVYVALLKIADQFKPDGAVVLKKSLKNVMASILHSACRWFQKFSNFHTLKYLSYERKINKGGN